MEFVNYQPFLPYTTSIPLQVGFNSVGIFGLQRRFVESFSDPFPSTDIDEDIEVFSISDPWGCSSGQIRTIFGGDEDPFTSYLPSGNLT